MNAFGFFSNSDCFDHAGQAWDSMADHSEDSSYYRSYGGRRERSNFVYDPLYFHTKHEVTIEHETGAAYLLKSSKGLFWVPKSLCRNRDGFYIWNRFKPTYLSE